ncbi:hypothetical protein [Streptomyces sp. NPDC059371]|uniref:hypothetical protein n=1 Tax=Streptomyces sp. NPDC059371 TaxID=3346812 RepID=UPI0036AEEF3B
MSAGVRRVLAWIVGGVCLTAIVGLVAVAVLDLDEGDRTASVVGAVVAVIGLALSVIILLMTPAGGTQSANVVRAQGRGALAAGRSVQGNAIGKGAKVTIAPTPPPAPPAGAAPPAGRRDVTARGEGAVSAGEDIVDNAIGEDSER